MASSNPSLNGQGSAQSSLNNSARSTPVVDNSNIVNDPDEPTPAEQQTLDAIRQGKQKAQEIMAANSTIASRTANNTANGVANGAPTLSRKRSRDGTQLPVKFARDGTVNSAEGEDGKPKEDLERTEVMVDRFISLDLMHVASGINHHKFIDGVIDQKRDEKNYYVHLRQEHRYNPAAVFGYGYAGFGNGTTDVGPRSTRIIYSSEPPPPKGRRNQRIRISRKDNQQQANQIEQLVPIRLDIELDKLRLRDTFTWNLQEKLISPELFTKYLMEDLKVPPENEFEIGRQILMEIEDQTLNYYPHVIVDDGPAEPGRVYADYKDDEMRIMIKLHITIGRVTLIDQFEWDINNPHNSPEEFAKHMAWENALSGEFTTAIAHSIREQSHQYTKSLWLTNHIFDGRPIEDVEVRDAFLPAPLHSSFRPQQAQKDWTPYMYEMSEAELDRTETVMMREHRAQKRQLNRRGGPALPDLKERQRTVRSLFVHHVIPGAVETWETSGIPKTRRAGRGGRRPGARGMDEDIDSSELESEEEAPESPLPSMSLNATIGTARTRGMRGAASAAQAAMRANYGRSLTPDIGTPQQDARSNSRRSLLRDESVADDGDQMIVKLKISRPRFRAWWDAYRAKQRASEFPLSGYASAPLPTAQPPAATPKKDAAVATPSITPRALRDSRTPTTNGPGSSGSRNVQYDDMGRVEADQWPGPDTQLPPPPSWLNTGIKSLRERHPESDFEPLMRPYCLRNEDDTPHRPNPPLEPGAGAPDGTRIVFAPRIRCNDCPGKVYTTLPGKVVEDFEVHLRNRVHKERVAERLNRQQGRSRRG